MEAVINLPNAKISIKIFDNIKFEKNGLIKYNKENNELKKIDLNYAIDIIDDLVSILKDALKGKFLKKLIKKWKNQSIMQILI